MSFRGRLALFFLLIVAIPVAAIALFLVEVTGDAQSGKADARLATALAAANALYEENVAAAEAAVTELVSAGPVADAFATGSPPAIGGALRARAQGSGLERLAVVTARGGRVDVLGSGSPFATATVRVAGDSGTHQVFASVTGPTEYVEDVKRLTGLDAALLAEDSVDASTNQFSGPGLPAAGASADVEVGGRTFRAAASDLPDGQATRVVVFSQRETGGFFASRPRIGLVVAIFVAVALAAIYFVARTLQGQVGAMLGAAQRIGSGDFAQRVPVIGRDEMAGLATEFNSMSERLQEQFDQLRRQRTELDRSVQRLGEAFAAGLDRDALLGIVAETALAACDARYCRIELEDGSVVELPPATEGPAQEAALAAQKRAADEGVQVAAQRGEGYALGARLVLPPDGAEYLGAMTVARIGRPFAEHERDVFLYLVGRASASIENISVHERVSEQAITDELTGLANNRAFRATIEREAARATRFGHELSLVILDVDNFKQVNDTYGHLQGDEVLRTIARILEREPRAIDEPARYGGEEFVVALPETGSAGAVELAERIRARLEETEVPAVEGGKPLKVTASFGTATMPDAATNVRDLFAAADQALYDAKRAGRNRVVTAPSVVRTRQ